MGSRDTLLLKHRTRDLKVASSNPGRNGGRIFFSKVNFVCWLSFDVRFTPVLLQRHIKCPSHSAKSAGGRLHLNTTHIFDPTKSEWADYAAVQAQCGNLSGTSSHATRLGTLGHSCLSLLSHCGTFSPNPHTWGKIHHHHHHPDQEDIFLSVCPCGVNFTWWGSYG